MNNLYIETDLENWKDIFCLNKDLQKLLIFRGQANKEWAISSALERLTNRIHPNYSDNTIPLSLEQKMIEEFQWKYPLFDSKIIDKNNYIEWLSIMQHYGAATRLIDFTDSFFIATHMALYESSTDAAIWAVNKHVLNKYIFDIYTKKNNTHSASHKLLNLESLNMANEKILNSFVQEENNMLIIRPEHSNERIYRQQGLFVMSTNIKNSFSTSLNNIISNQEPLYWNFSSLTEDAFFPQNRISVIKINIHKQLHREILNSLRQMNITSEILFPGIEGLAKSMNYTDFNI